MPLIEVANVSWSYDDEEANSVLHDVSLQLEEGRFLGIMGATGSGKTTLAQALRGIVPGFHDEGHFTGGVVVEGVDVSASDPQHTAREVGMVFQDAASQVIGTTVLQDATFGPANLGLDRDTVLSRARDYLSRVRLGGLDDRASSALSGGQIQRLAIAGVLAMEPGVLVLDEPVAELDPVGRREVCEILEELKLSGKATVVLIEQDPELVARFADEVAVMAEGRIVRIGAPREVFREARACLGLGVYPPEAALLAESLGVEGRTPLTAEELLDSLGARLAAGLARPEAPPAVEPGASVLEVDGLVFAYGAGAPVLHGVDLSIGAGEYVAVVGSNGAGKTTLTKHFNGLRRPTSGTVRVNGRDIRDVETADIADEVGYCFQNPDHQIFASTVLAEVGFGLECQGRGAEEVEARSRSILERFGIAELADTNPHSLGKGQRQKVALASIVVLEPGILVIDEPTTGLDWGECGQILDIVDQIRAAGTTVVAVTHDMRLVRERASRVVAMSAGRVVYDGTPAAFFADEDVMRLADVEATTLSRVTRAIAERIGADPEAMPVSVEAFLDRYGAALSSRGAA